MNSESGRPVCRVVVDQKPEKNAVRLTPAKRSKPALSRFAQQFINRSSVTERTTKTKCLTFVCFACDRKPVTKTSPLYQTGRVQPACITVSRFHNIFQPNSIDSALSPSPAKRLSDPSLSQSIVWIPYSCQLKICISYFAFRSKA